MFPDGPKGVKGYEGAAVSAFFRVDDLPPVGAYIEIASVGGSAWQPRSKKA